MEYPSCALHIPNTDRKVNKNHDTFSVVNTVPYVHETWSVKSEFHTTEVSTGISLEMIGDIQLQTITHKQDRQSMYDGTLRHFVLTIISAEKQ